MPYGSYDYKQNVGTQYDQYGNFLFGATGALWGYTSTELQAGGSAVYDIVHQTTSGNLPVNQGAIQSGYNAINNGGRVTVVAVPGGG
jgi:hypothetical protein